MASAAWRRPGSFCGPPPTGQRCGAEPFEVPPPAAGQHRRRAALCRRLCHAAVGPVEVVSVYRNPGLNACAGGAPESTHKLMGAVDMVPLNPITREALMTRLCRIHRRKRSSAYAGRPWPLQGPPLPHRRQEVPRMGNGRRAVEAVLGCRSRGRRVGRAGRARLPYAAPAVGRIAPEPMVCPRLRSCGEFPAVGVT